MNTQDLYVLWESRRYYSSHFPKRVLKLGNISAETRPRTHGQGFATQVYSTEILPAQRRCTGNSELGISSPTLKNTQNKAL